MYYSAEPGCKLCCYLGREEAAALADVRFKFGLFTRMGMLTDGALVHISRIQCLHRLLLTQLFEYTKPASTG